MLVNTVTTATDYLSPDKLQLVHSAILLRERNARPTDGAAVSSCLAERSACRLAEWHCPAPWIAASLVTPLLAEDADAYGLICSTVSPDVAQVARRYVELDRMDLPRPAGRRGTIWTPFQRLQKLFIASYLDEAVVFLSISDMLGRLAYTETASPEDTKTIAQQLEIVLPPLLERFGLWELRRDVSDRLFALTHPSEASDTLAVVKQYDPRRQEIFEQVEYSLLPILRESGVSMTLSHHPIHPASVFELTRDLSASDSAQNRSQHQHTFASRIAFNVTVEDLAQCYVALGAIHQLWRFVPGGFRDYIGSPRFNGYRMVHTTVRLQTPQEKTYNVEFYIGTRSISEANLWGRVQERRAGKGTPVQLLPAWWHNTDEERRILTTRKPGEYSSPTYAFSPLGQLYLLAPHSTPVDFAYAVHSQLGQFYKNAEVNGNEVPHNFALANADIVKIHIALHLQSQPHSRWLDYVKTPLAASKLRKQLARRYGRARDGRQLVEKAVEQQCQRFGIKLSETRLQAYLKEAAKWWHCADLESLFLRVVDGRPCPEALAVRIISREMAHRVSYPNGEPLRTRYHRVRIAQCCQPTLDDAIVGRFSQRGTRHEKVKIHTASCPQIPHDACTLDLIWRKADYEGLYEYLVFGADRLRILPDVLEPFYTQGAYLHKVQADRLEDGSAQFLLIAEAENAERAHKLEADLREIRDIYDCSSRPLAMSPVEVAVRKRTLRRSNPYTYDRPAYHIGDFVGRNRELEDMKDFINQTRLISPIVVHGPWRIGKTSLLRRVAQYDRTEFNAIAAYVNCHGIHNLELAKLLAEIASAISNRLRQEADLLGIHHLMFGHDACERLFADPMGEFRRYLRQVLRVLDVEKGPRLVIMIDEFSDLYDDVRRGKLDETIFRNLKELIEGSPDVLFMLVVQAVAIHEMQGTGLLEMARLMPLGPLAPEAAGDLLARRAQAVGLSFEEKAIAKVLELSGGNPYLLNVLPYYVVERLKETGEHVIRLSHVEPAVGEAFRGHAGIYFAHLCELLQNDTEWEIIRELTEAGGVMKSGTTIAKAMNRRKQKLLRGKTLSALDNLVNRGILATRSGANATTLYRLQIPLFARWLQTHGPIARKEKHHGTE